MRALSVLVLALACAAMVAAAVAFGDTVITAGVTVATQATPSEPAAMLLSGSALLGLAGAVKRLTM